MGYYFPGQVQPGGYPPRPEFGPQAPKPPDLSKRENWPGWLMTQAKLMPATMWNWIPEYEPPDYTFTKVDKDGKHLIDLEFKPDFSDLWSALWQSEFLETLWEIATQKTVDLHRVLTAESEVDGEKLSTIPVGGGEVIKVPDSYRKHLADRLRKSTWEVGMDFGGNIVSMGAKHELTIVPKVGKWEFHMRHPELPPPIKVEQEVEVRWGEEHKVVLRMISGDWWGRELAPLEVLIEGNEIHMKWGEISLSEVQERGLWPKVVPWAVENFMLDPYEEINPGLRDQKVGMLMRGDATTWAGEIHKGLQLAMSK